MQLKFLERGYDVLRRFEGRSSLKTYLTVVVRRLLLDWQDHTYGKWRPTATALRLGPHAVHLERLMNRDTYSAVEAVQQQTHRNQQILSERDPQVRRKSLDALRRTAADPALARDYMLKSSMIAGLRRAAEID